jgi:hypothetical protein
MLTDTAISAPRPAARGVPVREWSGAADHAGVVMELGRSARATTTDILLAHQGYPADA